MLISFTVTAKLTCAFVFAYADCWFSYGMAQLFCLSALMYTKIVAKMVPSYSDALKRCIWN